MKYQVTREEIKKYTQYDEICGAAFVNLYTLTKDFPKVVLYNFNPKNEEHLFVLGVLRGLATAFEKEISVYANHYQLWKLNRHFKKGYKINKATKAELIYGVDPEELLYFMRPKAMEICGVDFWFGDIYEAFYTTKKIRRKKGK